MISESAHGCDERTERSVRVIAQLYHKTLNLSTHAKEATLVYGVHNRRTGNTSPLFSCKERKEEYSYTRVPCSQPNASFVTVKHESIGANGDDIKKINWTIFAPRCMAHFLRNTARPDRHKNREASSPFWKKSKKHFQDKYAALKAFTGHTPTRIRNLCRDE